MGNSNREERRSRERGGLSTDALADILAEESRRRALAVMADQPTEWTSVDELIDEVEPEREQRFAIALHHTHLPKLEAYDVVERDGDAIRYRGSPRLEDWLDVPEADRS